MARRMTRTAANSDDDEGLVKTKDFKRAMKVYHSDIKPAMSKSAEYMQELSSAYKVLKRECGIQASAAKMAFKLDELEESRRDDWLRAFSGLLEELRIYMPSDLVDAAEGKKPAPNVIPINPKAPNVADAGLATLNDAVDEAVEKIVDNIDQDDDF